MLQLDMHLLLVNILCISSIIFALVSYSNAVPQAYTLSSEDLATTDVEYDNPPISYLAVPTDTGESQLSHSNSLTPLGSKHIHPTTPIWHERWTNCSKYTPSSSSLSSQWGSTMWSEISSSPSSTALYGTFTSSTLGTAPITSTIFNTSTCYITAPVFETHYVSISILKTETVTVELTTTLLGTLIPTTFECTVSNTAIESLQPSTDTVVHTIQPDITKDTVTVSITQTLEPSTVLFTVTNSAFGSIKPTTVENSTTVEQTYNQTTTILLSTTVTKTVEMSPTSVLIPISLIETVETPPNSILITTILTETVTMPAPYCISTSEGLSSAPALTCLDICNLNAFGTVLATSVATTTLFASSLYLVETFTVLSNGSTIAGSTGSSYSLYPEVTNPVFTWTQFGQTLSRTWPTVYVAYTAFSRGYVSAVMSDSTCATTSEPLTLPGTIDYGSLITPSASLLQPSQVPSEIISYITNLPEVSSQLEDILVTSSCDPNEGDIIPAREEPGTQIFTMRSGTNSLSARRETLLIIMTTQATSERTNPLSPFTTRQPPATAETTSLPTTSSTEIPTTRTLPPTTSTKQPTSTESTRPPSPLLSTEETTRIESPSPSTEATTRTSTEQTTNTESSRLVSSTEQITNVEVTSTYTSLKETTNIESATPLSSSSVESSTTAESTKFAPTQSLTSSLPITSVTSSAYLITEETETVSISPRPSVVSSEEPSSSSSSSFSTHSTTASLSSSLRSTSTSSSTRPRPSSTVLSSSPSSSNDGAAVTQVKAGTVNLENVFIGAVGVAVGWL
ncbi:hypothetical protein M501DRAFT_1028313 [Patellaria atrata CBS 101060]|uniref:Uncharacterized protein n=1 Tax=Patellaria atrata CBS 101060 TaxID=1346257 RepID=A0A9P4VX78_9PEZI|nr:hypothetical protein M501DRAFT_1028313 [Patellaria atrata CBS 101060]